MKFVFFLLVVVTSSRANFLNSLFSQEYNSVDGWMETVKGLFGPNLNELYSKTTPEIIQLYGYPVETHRVVTKDGYHLKLFRVPYGKKNGSSSTGRKGPIFLQHGLFCSSDDWFLLPQEKILPFLLAEEGYDVWLGNARGNFYSRGHEKFTEDLTVYWDFSFHEMGMFDIPAAFKYVLSTTGASKLNYAGHSMGTTMFFIAMDLHPELQGKVGKMVALSPVAYLGNMTSFVRGIANFPSAVLQTFFNAVSGGRVLPHKVNKWLNAFGPIICSSMITTQFCNHLIYSIVGYNPEQYPQERVCMVTGHTPSSTSAKTLIHFMQLVNPDPLQALDREVFRATSLAPRFQAYDYGSVYNLVKYQSQNPPVYNLTKNRVATFAIYADNDWLVDPKDALQTIGELGNVVKPLRVADGNYNHLDFTYADSVKTSVYDHIMRFLNND